MDEPVSMLDWGLFKLDEHFQSESFQDSFRSKLPQYELINPIIPPAIYDWDKNRIYIEINSTTDFKNEDDVRKYFSAVVRFIQEDMWINRDGYLSKDLSYSALDYYFSHVGFRRSSEPENIGEELDNITEFVMGLTIGETYFYFRSPLIGNIITIEKLW